MTQKLLLSLLLLFIFAVTHAQHLSDYQPLQATGTIPGEFITSSTKKYQADLHQVSENARRKDRKSQKQFYLESNFLVDDMLQSGMVLFNDPVSLYVRDVAREVLKDEPALFEKLRFYTIRSTAVNAFATGQGIILVTMGLMAQLENEAQLAFVLSHEIAHFEEKHSLELFQQIDKLQKKYDKPGKLLKTTGFRDALLAKSHYSKEKEMEADEKGLDRYLKSGYKLEYVLSFFDVLRYSYLPFDELVFRKDFFEKPYFQFPADYFSGEVNAVKGLDVKEDDSRSTHPNISTRREALRSKIKDIPLEGRQPFLVSKERFAGVQQTARFELPLYYLHNEEFYKAIYACYLLLEEHPENSYLRECIAKALYSIAKYRNNNEDYAGRNHEMEGEIQGLINFLEDLSKEEINILAVQYSWQLHKEMQEEQEIEIIAHDALVELVYHHDKKLSDFSDEPPPLIENDTIDQQAANAEEKPSKYDKIRQQQEKGSYTRFAFLELMQESDFTDFFNKAWDISGKRKERRDYFRSPEGVTEFTKNRREEERKGLQLGIDKVLIVNPFYLKLDDRRNDNKTLFVKTEEAQAEFTERIKENAKLAGLKTRILDVSSLKSGQVEQFNEITLLNEWGSEQIDFEDLSITPGYRQKEINDIAEKYGVNYMVWTGVISVHEKNVKAAYYLLAGIYYYPALPVFIYLAIAPKYSSLLFVVSYNLETGASEVVKLQYMSIKDKTNVLNMHLYDAFLQMNTKPDKL
jgi:beta-barrel assembly-enhancing protease